MTLMRNSPDGGAMVLLSSLVSMLAVIFLGIITVKNKIIKIQAVYSYIIFGLFFYAIAKIFLTWLVFMSLLSLDSVKSIFPDMGSLGEVAIKGWYRLASANDFIFPFVYFFIDKTSLKYKKLIKSVFIVAMFMSFTRSIWLCFLILCFFSSIKSINQIVRFFIGVLIFVLFLFFLESVSGADFIESINNRFFYEGVSSINEKNTQAFILFDEISKYPVFGKGLGTYVEDYIRNDRLKYGYEVAWFIYAVHFGLPVTFALLANVVLPVLLYGGGRKFISFVLFLTIGFTNPIVIGSLPAILYLIYYCSIYELQSKYDD